MPAAPSKPSSDKPRVDVRALSLTQLQKLAERGSRRAKAELEGRMRALASTASPTAAPEAASAPAYAPTPAPTPSAPRAPLRPAPQAVPVLTERAVAAGTGAPAQPPLAAAPLGGSAAPASEGSPAALPQQGLLEQLELMARQEQASRRVDGPPRLVGMALLAWGALMGLGGLVMLASGGGLYYFFCGLSAAAVGWLLLQCSRWAMALHGVLLLLALGWAWRGQAAGSVAMTVIQAAPLLIPAMWMLVRPVREPLA
ncbi:MAG: DUF3784 domain-containing protein [Pseudomonadota bacterium]|nr:DUF3784 domain-containing protein [Pseudomonadota bacterium]